MFKDDYVAILEVTNFVSEQQMFMAFNRFKELTKDQQTLLFLLTGIAQEELECVHVVETKELTTK